MKSPLSKKRHSLHSASARPLHSAQTPGEKLSTEPRFTFLFPSSTNVVLKVWSQTSSISISWKLVEIHVPGSTSRIRKSGEAQQFVIWQALWVGTGMQIHHENSGDMTVPQKILMCFSKSLISLLDGSLFQFSQSFFIAETPTESGER